MKSNRKIKKEERTDQFLQRRVGELLVNFQQNIQDVTAKRLEDYISLFKNIIETLKKEIEGKLKVENEDQTTLIPKEKKDGKKTKKENTSKK